MYGARGRCMWHGPCVMFSIKPMLTNPYPDPTNCFVQFVPKTWPEPKPTTKFDRDDPMK